MSGAGPVEHSQVAGVRPTSRSGRGSVAPQACVRSGPLFGGEPLRPTWEKKGASFIRWMIRHFPFFVSTPRLTQGLAG